MPPDAPDRFAAIPDTYRVAAGLAQLLDDWMDEYLAAFERRDPALQPGDTARLPNTRIRHAGIWRRGEPAPAMVVWPAGITDPEVDPEGRAFGTVQLGLMVVAQANDEDATTRLVQRYAACIRALLMQRPLTVQQADGRTHRHRVVWADEDAMGADVPESGAIKASVRFAYDVRHVFLGDQHGGPPPGAVPRDDPGPSWPGAPTIETVVPPEVIPTRTP